MRRERREFFHDHTGKRSLLWIYQAETGLLWMWAGLSCFLSSGDGYVGELLELQQGCEGPLEVPEVRCEKPRDASAEMGLISPGGENLLDFLELRQVLSTYDGDHRDPVWWPQETPVHMRVAREPLGIPLPSMLGPKTL